MDPSRRRHLLPQGSPASLRRRSSFSPPQLPTSATPLASQSAGDGSGGYPPNLVNPLSWSLGRTAGTSSRAGSSSHEQNAFSTPVLESFQFHFEDGPVSDDIGAVGHFIDQDGLCGVTPGPGDVHAGAGQVDGRPVDGKSVQIRVLNSSEPEANSGTLVLEQPALPAPFPKAAGPARSKRPPSGASPRAGGSVKRSRLSICNRPTPGASGSGSSDTSAGPGGAGNRHLSVGSGASPPAAGGGGINGGSPGVGGPVSSGPLTMAMGRGGAALFEMAREVKPSEAHMKKIIKDRRLAELALTDPGKVRSLLAGRVYFAKREKDKANRKQELEKMVETLTKRISTLSDTLSEEQSKDLQIRTENSELMTKLRSMEGMSQLTKARQTALISEVSVRKAKYDAMLSHKLNTSCQERKR